MFSDRSSIRVDSTPRLEDQKRPVSSCTDDKNLKVYQIFVALNCTGGPYFYLYMILCGIIDMMISKSRLLHNTFKLNQKSLDLDSFKSVHAQTKQNT